MIDDVESIGHLRGESSVTLEGHMQVPHRSTGKAV